jgi:myosin V
MVDSFQQRSQENGHILNGNVAYAEMKPSIYPTETIPSMVVRPSI